MATSTRMAICCLALTCWNLLLQLVWQWCWWNIIWSTVHWNSICNCGWACKEVKICFFILFGLLTKMVCFLNNKRNHLTQVLINWNWHDKLKLACILSQNQHKHRKFEFVQDCLDGSFQKYDLSWCDVWCHHDKNQHHSAFCFMNQMTSAWRRLADDWFLFTSWMWITAAAWRCFHSSISSISLAWSITVQHAFEEWHQFTELADNASKQCDKHLIWCHPSSLYYCY